MLSSRVRMPRWAWSLAALVLVPAVVASCGGQDDPKGFLGGSGGLAQPGPCMDGITRDCSVKIAEQMGIVHCYVGTQTCSEGMWSTCEGGDMVAKAYKPGGTKPYSLSTEASCSPADPCDPSCQEWVEVPAPVYENLGLPAWSDGGDPPTPALSEPCIDAIDCQNDHRCVDPAPEREANGRLVDDGLVVRYFLDEADSGTAVTTVRDSSFNPLDLTATYAGNMTWSSGTGGRGLLWSATDQDDRADALIDGTKVLTLLEGSQTATLELVLDLTGTTASPTRLLHIGSGTEAGRLSLRSSGASDINLSWENTIVASYNYGVVNAGRLVVQMMIDSTQGIGGNRHELFVNGTEYNDNGGTPITQNDTLTIGAGRSLVIGNRAIGGRSPQGAIYYAAIYHTALTREQLDQNRRILMGLDDAYVEHPKCEPGGPLYQSSDRCIEDVCAANPGCCTRNNDCHALFGGDANVLTPGVCDETSDTCYMAFQSDNGTTCDDLCTAGGGTCVDMYDNRNDTNACGIDPGTGAGCASATLPRGVCVCTKPATGAWDATCIQAVHDECGAYCESTGDSGTCLEWGPGETDPDCGGIDMTLHTGCAGTLVACNRGNSDIPTGQTIPHWDGQYDEFPGQNPTSANPHGHCTTPSLIAPGQCIDVPCAGLDSTVDEREVVANVTESGQIAECHNGAYKNNWALHDNNVVCTNPQSCDLEMALQSGVCNYPLANAAYLEAMAAYSVGYDDGSGSVALVDVGAVGSCTGATNQYYTDDPNQPTSLVLCPNTCAAITTQADVCSGTDEHHDATNDRCYYYPQATATWANARTACQGWGGDLAVITSQAEQTFVSGLVTTASATTHLGGYETLNGTNRWRWVTDDPWGLVWWAAGEPNDTGGTENWLQMLASGSWNDIDAASTARYMCERHQPIAKTLSFSGTCDALQIVQHSETYTATCPSGQHAVWGLLAWDALTPQDANILWEVRTADDVPGLTSASWATAGTTISTPSDNQVCAMASEQPPAGFPPGPTTCPVDLYQTLGGVPEATRDVLELRMTLNPGTLVGATVNQWQVRHSCVDAE